MDGRGFKSGVEKQGRSKKPAVGVEQPGGPRKPAGAGAESADVAAVGGAAAAKAREDEVASIGEKRPIHLRAVTAHILPLISLLSRSAAAAAASPWMRRRDGFQARIPPPPPSSTSLVARLQRCSSFLPSMDELDGDAVQPDHGHDYATHKRREARAQRSAASAQERRGRQWWLRFTRERGDLPRKIAEKRNLLIFENRKFADIENTFIMRDEWL
ncbi:uncharacterized protein [Triticum aestivum]|uniref:uncharacterized protein n=1 Tax=Triticum aestivum TaxID=4565 RepID=UPI001D0300A2|nr:uncharacterized protein LOC123129848 [Triticum aestivum]XP_044405778.1 uncharacterized protein LOC123129848 [Triticum aestivum]XP_044405780.1 uncharacterized protein LOC123129848 [Triticum aestivum]XP_044405782.1 uncharacterized protein LOC123129848 [Triticum aestivum]XP_044405787.1 uncharacterized protein LOC123129848 [Triticum aestivum]XP_044405792.1 uncharacterized protein LOC123129848 [Triticum aestivum]